ncbi:hypothetical protein [Paraburkholderia sp. DHOC27]|uniref:hypothetical protein n=1 Tax=Paraburkholderia sp. DHOC27 TaxID=2303330 RepID=UPI000E3E77D7|nr:hypothetical protein [Paraburkholderia sp. DHOC27]RFU49241.1 hypothetical protein D0B32_05395 [Paraburkholderia sp. DHOC27]
MSFSLKQIKYDAVVAWLAASLMLGAAGACFGQTEDAAASASSEAASVPLVSDVNAQPSCSSVVLSCNVASRTIAPEHELLDAATARDQAQRAQAHSDQDAAEQALRQRIAFEREHPDAIFVYGSKSTPKESVADVFNRSFGVASTDMTTSSFDSVGRRTECVNACRGPFCCITTRAATDSH